jgi:hypothetical protein
MSLFPQKMPRTRRFTLFAAARPWAGAGAGGAAPWGIEPQSAALPWTIRQARARW